MNIQKKASLYIAVWGLALFILLVLGAPVYWIPFLPLGLILTSTPIQFNNLFPFILVVWVLYLIHAVFYFNIKKPIPLWILYGFLVIVLVINVHGCQQLIPDGIKAMNDFSNIH